VTCWVSDTGAGIADDQLKRIFEKGAADPNVPGSTGLGLTIVEKAMQLHRGKISVESTPAAGSSFRVEFPKRARKIA
jgi:signal transduction histidine kinase